MTDNQKNQIAAYRDQGIGYTQIAKKMNIPVNSIKSYCKRHGLGGVVAYNAPATNETYVCENCGALVKQNPGRKLKRFCSDKCRMAWWNSHQDQVKRKAVYEYTCPTCKKTFSAYGNSHRRYCSRECYIEDRFGGGAQ